MSRFLWMLLALPLVACDPNGGQGTDSGNALTASLTVSADGAAIGGRDVANITTAWMTLEKGEFEGCDGDDEEVDYEGPLAVDLLSDQVLGEIELSFTTVCELEFYISAAPDDFDPVLAGRTLYVEGTTNGGVPFELSSERTWEFEVEEELTLAEALNRFTLLFDTDLWFRSLDPDDGELTDGTVVIDEQNNPGLLFVFEDNVEDSANLFED